MSWLPEIFRKAAASEPRPLSGFDFAKLDDTRHNFEWFADEPYETIRSHVENLFNQQILDSRVTAFRVKSDPEWTASNDRSESDGDKIVHVRLMFEFDLTAEAQGYSHYLSGSLR